MKFTTQGEVVVTVHRASAPHPTVVEPNQPSSNTCTLRIAVRDTGIGIAVAAQQHLFQPFAQADDSTTRKYGGTGLGLAIAKQLAEKMGGTMAGESAPGCGSTFWFTVSLATDSSALLEPTTQPLRGRHLLVVDDNATNRSVIQHQIAAWGATSAAKTNGLEALAHLQDLAATGRAYDGVILDRQMPGMDGLELARAIKLDQRFAGIPVVMLTSVGLLGDEAEARAAGIAAYVSKPTRQTQLRRCLVQLFNQAVPMVQTVAATHGARAVSRTRGSMRVLLAEDHPVNQQVARAMLEQLDYVVGVVETGRAAVDALARASYDLVLMDCHMPEMDDFEAVAVLRAQQVDRKLPPIIALTADALDGSRELCLAAGMDDYLRKPYTEDQLRAVAQRWVEAGTHPVAA